MARTIATRLERAPVHAMWVRRDDSIAVELDRTLFVAGTRFLLYSGAFAVNVPRVMRAVHDGDYRPFLSTIGSFAGLLNEQLAAGLFLAVICAEDVDRIDSAKHAQSAASTLLGTVGVRGLMDACRDWPRAAAPPELFVPVQAPVPTLMFSGATDPITPPWHTERQAAMLPNARHVVIPHASHVDLQACEFGIIARFLESGSVSALDVSCSESRPPRRFAHPARQ